MPINVSLLCSTKAFNKNSDLVDNKENTPANDSHVTETEEYLNQQYDHAELVHLKGLKGK